MAKFSIKEILFFTAYCAMAVWLVSWQQINSMVVLLWVISLCVYFGWRKGLVFISLCPIISFGVIICSETYVTFFNRRAIFDSATEFRYEHALFNIIGPATVLIASTIVYCVFVRSEQD